MSAHRYALHGAAGLKERVLAPDGKERDLWCARG